MEIDLEEVLKLLGQKEIELYILRKQNTALVSELEGVKNLKETDEDDSGDSIS